LWDKNCFRQILIKSSSFAKLLLMVCLVIERKW
jgi:hypothetical protein